MSSNLITDLAQVNLIKQNIKNAIINKGMIVTDFNSYSGAIENIETGGGAYQYSNLESMYNSASNRYNGDIGVIYNSSNLGGIYQHNGINFNPINTGLNAIQDQVWGSNFYGKNSILNGTLNKTTNLSLQQLKDRVNLYGNISNLSFDNSVTSLSDLFAHDSSIVNVPNFNTVNITGMDFIFAQCDNLISVPTFNTINVVNMESAFHSCNNLSNESIQNIVNMCINSNIPSGKRNISNVNSYSPLYSTKFDNSYYSNRLSDLTNAGWSY